MILVQDWKMLFGLLDYLNLERKGKPFSRLKR
jgi:hypothetical protein